MSLMGGVALAANLACFFLLYRHRGDSLDLRSTWLCSRNDLIANVGVLLAAAGSYRFAWRWPDIVMGGLMASLFLGSEFGVLRQSTQALRVSSAPPSQTTRSVVVRRFSGARNP